MKKLSIFIIILVGFVLIIRFVEVKTPPLTEVKPVVQCSPDNTPQTSGLIKCSAIESINKEYIEKIKPIATEKCLMCHGHVDKMPLYSFIPPSSILVNHDIEEAKEKYDMTFDYPFAGDEGSDLSESLEELSEVIDEGEMPPPIYLVMHWKSTLTKAEQTAVIDWVKASQDKLKASGYISAPETEKKDNDEDD